jgi:hypothetical protein
VISEEAFEGRHLPGEVRLFRRVILSAILEAIYGSIQESDPHARIRADAVQWFVEADGDFQLICACADLPPDSVRKDALAYIRRERDRAPGRRERPRLNPTMRLKRAA